MSPSRTREWHDEWEGYWSGSGWRLWVWAFVAAHYWPRRWKRLWSWWVAEWLDMVLLRSRIRNRVDDIAVYGGY